MSLIEYIPELRESLQRHCNAAGVSAELRRNLLKELSAGKLGPPIELDVIGGRYRTCPFLFNQGAWL